jgi:exopolysaccharide production protein ExoQ
MSPSRASLLCVGFIAWLVYRDLKRSPRTAIGLWIPTIWVGIMASKPVLYWFIGNSAEMSFDTYLDGNATDRNILLVLLFLGIITLVKRGVSWRTFISTNRLLLLFYFYLAASVLWAEYPFVALKRYIKDIGNVLMILVILTEQRPVEAIRHVFVRCAYVLVPLSVLFIKYYPDIGRYYHPWTYQAMYSGVTTNKNSLGVLAMVSGLFLLWSVMEGQKKQKVGARVAVLISEGAVLAMCLWLLKKADSATSLACLVLGSATLIVCRLKYTRTSPRLVTWSLLSTLVLSALFLMSPAARGLVASTVGRDPTLTTRTDIWAAAMNLKTEAGRSGVCPWDVSASCAIFNNVLFGAGYASVWLTEAGRTLAQELKIPHAHNGYLETYLNTGLIGATLLVLVLLKAGRRAANILSEGSALGALYMALYLSGVIYNYTEVTFNVNNVVCFSLWLVAVNYPAAAAEKSAATIGAADPPRPGPTPTTSARKRRQADVREPSARRRTSMARSAPEPRTT